MKWLKNLFTGFMGICFQDLPYLINRIFRHVDFHVNRIRILESASDSTEERNMIEPRVEERE
jgi:hypothetical protein